MPFIYDPSNLTPAQIRYAYDLDLHTLREQEDRLEYILDTFKDIDQSKIDEIMSKLIDIRLRISNLEAEYNILTL
jgi:hypothetical protein